MVIYVDVDDTLVRHAGTKRIPVVSVVAHVRKLRDAGFTLFCWSTGGSEYAQAVVRELGLEECFSGFLPKPNVVIDDQDIHEWKRFIHIHPLQIDEQSIDGYLQRLKSF